MRSFWRNGHLRLDIRCVPTANICKTLPSPATGLEGPLGSA